MQLALPSRDYYLKADSEGDMKAYHRYMTEVAKLLGANASRAAEELQEVIRFERELASVSSVWVCPKVVDFMVYLVEQFYIKLMVVSLTFWHGSFTFKF
jgi:predicted metalloendopeptidase